MNPDVDNPLLPQKISFSLKGGLNSEYPAYRTKSVCKNPYNTSKYLVL